jgi:hypothetical protein
MSDFPNGIIAKRNERAPKWALCKLSIKVDEFIQTLQQNADNGWCNFEVNLSKAGKPYVKFDDFKPNGGCSGYVTQQTNQMPQRQAPPPPPFHPEDDNFPGLGTNDTPPF